MKKVTFTIPSLEDCEISIECLPEDMDVRGNLTDSGDEEQDREDEDNVLNELESGNLWAWCCVRVTVSWRGFSGSEYLGGCNYRSEQDFKESGYFEDMAKTAHEIMVSKLESLAQ